MINIINGKDTAGRYEAELKEKVARMKAQYGRIPFLAVILVGDDPASQTYVRNKQKAAERCGIVSTTFTIPAESCSEKGLLRLIEDLNIRQDIDGILVQLPLPDNIDESKIISAIRPDKDVDGFCPENVAGLWTGRECTVPCTPKGIVRLLTDMNLPVSGKKAVVVGRSSIVGLPVAKLLLDRNATVTVCHSKTLNLKEVTRQADILVSAVGKPKFITGDMVSEGCTVIDVGINRDPDTGKLCGDVDFESVSWKADYITPVPGGVGPMTIAMLMENTVELFERRMKKLYEND